jgi:ribosomal protein S7
MKSSKTIYTNLLGCLTKNGKKIKATKLLNTALRETSKLLQIPITRIFIRLARSNGMLIELKKVRRRRNIHLVPFPVNSSRRYYLLSKQIIDAVNRNKKKTKTFLKLTNELSSILGKHNNLLDKKKQYINEILSNRSNTHFRW